MHNSKKQAFARYKMKNFTLRWTKDTDSLDYPELLLCMALSHIVAGNPFFGASLFLFAGLVRTLFLNRRLVTGNGGGDHYLYYFGMTAILSLGLSLAIFFPGYISRPQANAVTLFIVLLMIRDLLFYPLYSDSRRHLFCIGEPVEYDPSLPSRESKQQIAAQLHERMTALASGKDDGESK